MEAQSYVLALGAKLAASLAINDNTHFADWSFSLLRVKPMPHPGCEHVRLARADPH